MDQQRPRPERLILAFLIAPLAPSALAATWTLFDGVDNGGYLQWLRLFALVAYPTALVFGAPAYFLLRNRVKPRLVSVALMGGLVAAAPWILLAIFGPAPDFASSGSRVTVENGSATLWGWIGTFRLVSGVFVLGLIGGLTFWLVALGLPGRKRHGSPPELDG
ncbi:hypothetical protein [Phenylobacterium sp.]|uniref:hypothetical protein n=1 Tax=Phenylobacterium sp. TaxID=1871053 RepID=UPI002608BCF4|nr:hypothetical protein [Phenylobacterium sp.]